MSHAHKLKAVLASWKGILEVRKISTCVYDKWFHSCSMMAMETDWIFDDFDPGTQRKCCTDPSS